MFIKAAGVMRWGCVPCLILCKALCSNAQRCSSSSHGPLLSFQGRQCRCCSEGSSASPRPEGCSEAMWPWHGSAPPGLYLHNAISGTVTVCMPKALCPTMIAPAPFVLLNQQQYLLGNLPNPSEEGFSLPMAQLPKASYIRGLVCTMNTSPLIPADTSSTTTGIFFCKHFHK